MNRFSWLDKNKYPFQSNFLQLDNVNMHYLDEGNGPVILLIHGTPSWSFDFRHLIKALKNAYRCIALDHIGFGLSDKPKDYHYTLDAHVKNVQSLMAHLSLDRFSLILHDIGGPIGLKIAQLMPEKIEKMIIINSWIGSAENTPEFKKLKRVLKSPILPILYRYLNFSPRFLLPASFGEKKLNKNLLKQYTSPFANNSQREGPLAFANSLLHDQDWFKEIWLNRKTLINIPALLIWGEKDRFIPIAMLERFAETFPNHKIIKLPTVGHFPQEECPKEIIPGIKSFLAVRP